MRCDLSEANNSWELAKEISISVMFHLKKHKDSISLPFIHRFPSSCCEITTIILAVKLINSIPELNLYIVTGYAQPKDEWHFWIEVCNEKVIDITASQFPDIGEPIFGSPNPVLLKKFSDKNKKLANEFLQSNDMYLNNSTTIQMLCSEIGNFSISPGKHCFLFYFKMLDSIKNSSL